MSQFVTDYEKDPTGYLWYFKTCVNQVTVPDDFKYCDCGCACPQVKTITINVPSFELRDVEPIGRTLDGEFLIVIISEFDRDGFCVEKLKVWDDDCPKLYRTKAEAEAAAHEFLGVDKDVKVDRR